MNIILTESEQNLMTLTTTRFQEAGWCDIVQCIERGKEISSVFKWLESCVGTSYTAEEPNLDKADWAAFKLRSHNKDRIAFIFKDKNAAMHFKLAWC